MMGQGSSGDQTGGEARLGGTLLLTCRKGSVSVHCGQAGWGDKQPRGVCLVLASEVTEVTQGNRRCVEGRKLAWSQLACI